MISAAVIGGTGYTGFELVRLLVGHPQVALSQLVSRSEAGRPVAEVFPALRGHSKLTYSAQFDAARGGGADIVFFATPSGVAMQQAEALLAADLRVVDLAADFRLADAQEWAQWYGKPHACPALIDEAVYGLPEIYRERIRGARLIANPGCYPTSVILGFKPLLEAGAADLSCLLADSKSGVSGAGRNAQVGLLFGELSENFKAYKASAHQHWPEIRQQLEHLAGTAVSVTFTPHLLPVTRGILSTLYFKTELDRDGLQACFEEAYADEPFVTVAPADSHPELREVRGTNHCLVAVHKPETGGFAKVIVVIDNLVKGAAGQAVHNMNLMFGLDETSGLSDLSWMP